MCTSVFQCLSNEPKMRVRFQELSFWAQKVRLRIHAKLGERRRPRAKCSSELHFWNLSPIPCKWWWVLEFRVLVQRFSLYFFRFWVSGFRFRANLDHTDQSNVLCTPFLPVQWLDTLHIEYTDFLSRNKLARNPKTCCTSFTYNWIVIWRGLNW